MDFSFVFIYFVYGLAFFSMGLAMTFEARRSPLLAEARALWPLALFGLVHGAHEWLEMLLDIRGWFNLTVPSYISGLRLFMLVISFIFLVIFSLQTLRPSEKYISSQNLQMGGALLAICALLVILTNLNHPQTAEHWIAHADVLARYTLAIPGAGLAALALNRQEREAFRENRSDLGRVLRLAAVGFAFYGMAQAVVRPLDIFPARYLNTTVFREFLGFPVQTVRAVMAMLITISLSRASQIVEDERQEQLAIAQKARLEAMELIRMDLEEREAMRRELLRHTVIAQEDERGRIARELHDETAQFLTAFTLNLATLQNYASGNQEVSELVERLQSLSRDISNGIYRMVHDLRPAQLDDLGLVAALRYLADEERERTGMEVNLRIEGKRQRLDPLVETVVFRVAQEALSNVARHAQCDQAQMCLAFSATQVNLRVIDEGVGFLPQRGYAHPHGWGLAGMRERAEAVGGNFILKAEPGHGTTVEILIPLKDDMDMQTEEDINEPHPHYAG